MKLISCKIENFGKLQNTEFTFQDGLNVIFRENGFGKSTLAAFLRIMFYGLSGERKSQDNENERKRYRPWQGGAFGGTVIFQLENGRSYRLSRSFGERKSQDQFRLYDAETNLPSQDFTEEIGEELFQIDELSFRRTCFIGQQALETGVTSEINARIGNVSEDPEDMKRYAEVMEKLKDELNALSPNRRTGAIFRKRLELESLQTDCRGREALEQQALSEDDAEYRLRETRQHLREQLEHTGQRLQNESMQQDAREQHRSYLYLCERLEEEKKRYQEQERRFFGADFDRLPASERLQRLQQAQRRLQEVFRNGLPTEAELREAAAQLSRLDALREGERHTRRKPETPKNKTASGTARILRLCGLLLLTAALLSFMLSIPRGLCAGLFGFGAVLLVLSVFLHAGRASSGGAAGEPEAAAKSGAAERAALLRALDSFLQRFYPDLRCGGAKTADAARPGRLTLLRQLEQDVLSYRHLEDLRTAAEALSKRQQAVEAFKQTYDPAAQPSSAGQGETIVSLTTKLNSLRTQLEETEEKLQLLSGQRKQHEAQLSELYEKERRLAAGQEELSELEERSRLLTLVRDHLVRARNDFSKQYMDPLMRSFSYYYRMLCSKEAAYIKPEERTAALPSLPEENTAVKDPELPFLMDADFNLQLTENGREHSPELLSAGFRNLVALARRMAFVDAMYEKERPFLILDDPFVNLDADHLEGGLRFLQDIAEHGQVIYFTCVQSRAGISS